MEDPLQLIFYIKSNYPNQLMRSEPGSFEIPWGPGSGAQGSCVFFLDNPACFK